MEGMSGGLYIPGAKVPASCNKCYDIGLAHRLRDLGGHCPRMDLHYSPDEQSFKNDRRADCPLVDVPAHGRLIDTSEKIRVQIYDDMTEDFHMVEMTINDLLNQGWVEAVAPTIIPAEEVEES